MKKFYLIRYTKNQGRINKTLEGIGVGLLKLWALQNTTSTTESIIFDEDGVIVFHCVGKKNSCPVCEYDLVDDNIEDYVPGILLSLKEGVNA